MKAWEEFLALQEIELGIETVHKWLRTLKILHFDAGNLYLEAKDSFQATWFEEHIRKKIQAKFVNNNNKKIKVHLTIVNASPKKQKNSTNFSTENKLPIKSQFYLIFDELDPYCTFEHYVFSEKNLLVEKLFKSIAGYSELEDLSDEGAFNPIYIYGKSGLGKTHLLMALAQALTEKGKKVVYARAETFTEHVVSAIRKSEMSIFRQAYRNSDILIIDGVQVLSNKAATQEELFHTFNTLHLENKQIIISANCAPVELQQIEPRLVSRFEWGIVLHLLPLEKKDLTEVLIKKANFLKFPIHEKVISYLLENFPSGNKARIKALEALVLRSHINNQPNRHSGNLLTIPLAKQILQDLLKEEMQYLLTPEKIIRTIAQTFGIKAEDILGKNQTRECVFPRQLAMYLCRQKLKMPFTKIGKLFSKDHSTAMTSIKLIQKGIELNDKELISAYQTIEKKLDTNQTNEG